MKHAERGWEPRTFEELGSGQEQVLALVFAHAYARAFYGGIVLVIEEPEAHLHPLAQQWLGRKIRQMAGDGLQVILTTHNPAFVDVLGLEGVVLVRKFEGATQVRQLTAVELADFCKEHGAGAGRTKAETILPFYANSATEQTLSGLFAVATPGGRSGPRASRPVTPAASDSLLRESCIEQRARRANPAVCSGAMRVLNAPARVDEDLGCEFSCAALGTDRVSDCG